MADPAAGIWGSRWPMAEPWAAPVIRGPAAKAPPQPVRRPITVERVLGGLMNKPLVLLAAACIALCLGVSSAWPESESAAAARKQAPVPVTAHPKGHFAALDALPDW